MNPADPFPPRSQDWPSPDGDGSLAGSPPTRPGPTGRLPDPGNPRRRSVALVVLIAAFVSVFGLQQFRAAAPLPEPSERYEAPDTDMFSLTSRAITKIAVALKKQQPTAPIGSLQQNLDTSARTPVDRFRAAIVAAELIDATTAAERLKSLSEAIDQEAADAAKAEAATPPSAEEAKVNERTAEARGRLRTDVEVLRGVYAGEYALDDVAAKGLIERYGWFGRVAATQGETDIKRAQLFQNGMELLLVLFLVGSGAFVVGIASLVCLVLVLVKVSSGKFRAKFSAPAPGGSVYLETVAVFVVSFVLLTLGFEAIDYGFQKSGKPSPEWLGLAHMALQWVLLLVIFWPRTRGVELERWKRDTGLNMGEGFWKEASSGVFVYLASLPLLVLAGVVSLLLNLLRDAIRTMVAGKPVDAGIPHNPILDILMNAPPLMLVLLFVLATCWAPLVEETIFRGCMYRHLRSRVNWVGAAIVSALMFGGMHGYEFVNLLPVITLGFVFSAMREWRSSLVASITCHLLHNCTVLLIAITIVQLIKSGSFQP